MGAGKWCPEYSDLLKGKHVTIFPDNDEKGRSHVEEVAQSLTGKAASVRIAWVPTGKDVSDWIASGAGDDDIASALNSAIALGCDDLDKTKPKRMAKGGPGECYYGAS